MGSRLRHALEGDVVHVTSNTVCGRYLMVPGSVFNLIFIGVLRLWQVAHGMDIIAVAVLDNHFHLLLRIRSQTQLSHFMRDFKSMLARKIKVLRGVTGPIFESPYTMKRLLNPEEVMAAYIYLLSNSTKENLVHDPRRWPGVHSANELCGGAKQLGEYFDKKAYEAARKRNRNVDPKQFIRREPIALTPLPNFEGLNRHQREAQNRHIVKDIVRDCGEARGNKGVLGVAAILVQDPMYVPREVKRSRVEHVGARGPNADELIKAAKEAYRATIIEYRAALRAFYAGHRPHRFPEGCFLPLMVDIEARLDAAAAAQRQAASP